MDMAPDPDGYAIHYRFLETFDESFDYDTDPTPGQGRWQIHGIGLPDEVLRKVYSDNARRILRLGSS
jgi:predicted TIM-barrel fold metal-dependent hydrolase